MPGLNAERLKLDEPKGLRLRRRAFREWCFVKALLRRFRLGALILLLVLLGSTAAFLTLLPQDHGSFGEAAWDTWRLLLGDLSDDLLPSPLLNVLMFALPIIGLAALAQGLVEFILMLRDRRLNERGWSETMAHSSKNHVILVGLGRLGYRSWLLLDRLGENVVVIERDATNRFLEEVRSKGGPLLVGDGRADELLVTANIAQARSIILATNDDLANLEMALDARRMNPRIRVILRLFDQNMANKVREGFDIHIAMSQSALSAPAFAMAAHDPSIVNSFVIDDRLVVMQRWEVRAGGPLDGKPVGHVRSVLKFGVVQATRASGEAQMFPEDGMTLRGGDKLLVQGPFEALQSLRERGLAAELATAPPVPAR